MGQKEAAVEKLAANLTSAAPAHLPDRLAGVVCPVVLTQHHLRLIL